VQLYQGQDQARAPVAQGAQVRVEIPRPGGPVQAVPVLAGAEGQAEEAVTDRDGVDPDRVGLPTSTAKQLSDCIY